MLSGRLSGCLLISLSCDAISLLSGSSVMKLATNIHQASGHL